MKITHEELREALKAGLSNNEIASKFGMSASTIRYRKLRLKETGFDPENEREYSNPVNHPVRGYSGLYRLKEKGDTSAGKVLEWVKTHRDDAEFFQLVEDWIDSLCREMPVLDIEPVRNMDYDENSFSVLPIGDPHIGLLTWSKEVGEDWDLNIANRVFSTVFKRLLDRTPCTREVVLVNTGDFFHADNLAGVTSRSGNRLDLDGRHGKWLDAGIVLYKMFIHMCLAKYEKVTVINVAGNHDDMLGLAIGLMMKHIFSNNPRVEIHEGTQPFHYVKRGKVLLGFAHGHTCKLNMLAGQMAQEVPELWGQTTYRHWITGHVHHKQFVMFKEVQGCSMESVGIIPPKDAWAFGGGYGGRRTLQLVVYDERFGESDRYNEYVRETD